MPNMTTRFIFGLLLVAVLVAGILIGRRTPVEEAAAPALKAQAAAPQAPIPVRDPYQRSLAIFEFKKAAASGAERGREIFYYKCWFCHNEFAGRESAPDLSTVFERKQLLSGRPATVEGIKEEIREGGAGMAAYKYALSEEDLDDLVTYLRADCCWNSDAPPPNPRFTANQGE